MTRSSTLATSALLVMMSVGCRRPPAAALTELQRINSVGVDVVLLADHDVLRQGKDQFLIEFKSASSGKLVDVGTVRGTATMPMPGMPMFGTIQVHRTDAPGRYAADSELGMAGTWRMTIEWDGPAGHESVSFSRSVH